MMQGIGSEQVQPHFTIGDVGNNGSETPPPSGASIEFQEIAHTHSQPHHDDRASLLHPDTTSVLSAAQLPLPASPVDEAQSGAAGASSSSGSPSPNASFYQLAYYKCYFDVDTFQILGRIRRAAFPFLGTFYTDSDPNPDLYGPFWICTTLVFFMAAAGNFANYLQFINDSSKPASDSGSGSTPSSEEPSVWTYDFKKVTLAATMFYGWISLIPLLVYCAFLRIGREEGAPAKGLVELASLFGYSLVTLLPVCLLCIAPISLLRWIAVSTSFAFSSFFLVRNIGVDVHNRNVLPVIACVVGLNLAAAIGIKFYFFDF